ncbi:MAG: hypothetical protein KF819_28730 [Labilithrix sp.]|nr:hypothetical protein [Labilithrix sp.]
MRKSLAALAILATLATAACEPLSRQPTKTGKCPPCPPPPEPEHQAAVVGTIGKMHMVESRYPLSKLGEVLASFKPDLVLIAVRVDPFRAHQLEDASFEMTYVHHLARQRGISVEPVDWFREEDFGAAPPPAEPWDVSEIAKREADVLAQPRLFTFDQANGAELEQRVLLALAAEARHRGGNPVAARRQGWLQQLTASAVARHERPKRVLAYVDVFDRPVVDMALHAVGYATKPPLDIQAAAKEAMIDGVPPDVIAELKSQLERARARAEKAKGPEKAFWADRERVLDVVVEKRASCCVTQTALTAPR